MKMKRNSSYMFAAVLCAVSVLLAGCGPDDGPTTGTLPVTTTQVTVNVAESVLLPVVFSVDAQVLTLSSASANFITSNSQADLDTLRKAWREAHRWWAMTEPYLFGAAPSKNISEQVDLFPVYVEDIKEVLKYQNINAELIQRSQGSVKGFHVLEYLIFGANGTKLPSEFTDKERQYIGAVVQDLMRNTQALRESWNPFKGNFIDQIKHTGSGGQYANSDVVLREMIDTMIASCKKAASIRIGMPLLKNDLFYEESRFSKNTANDLIATMTGARYIYQGGVEETSYGLSGLLYAKGQRDLAEEINAQFGLVLAQLTGLTPTFSDVFTTNKQAIIDVKNAIDALIVLLETRMRPILI
jgi:putative iron-regulated protein